MEGGQCSRDRGGLRTTIAGVAVMAAVLASIVAVWASASDAPWERSPEILYVDRIVVAPRCAEMRERLERTDVALGERVIVLDLIAKECL